MNIMFDVSINYYSFESIDRYRIEYKCVSKDNAMYLAKLAMDCCDVTSVCVVDSMTGEVLYSNGVGEKEYIAD